MIFMIFLFTQPKLLNTINKYETNDCNTGNYMSNQNQPEKNMLTNFSKFTTKKIANKCFIKIYLTNEKLL